MPRTTKVISISTLPHDLRRFDSAARRAGLSRSQFFNQAAARAVADYAPPRTTMPAPTNTKQPDGKLTHLGRTPAPLGIHRPPPSLTANAPTPTASKDGIRVRSNISNAGETK